MQLVGTVDDVDTFGRIAGHWSRGRPVTFFGPGEGERDEAVDLIFLPGCIYDDRVGRAVFCHSLKRCPVIFNGFEGSLSMLVVCSLKVKRPL